MEPAAAQHPSPEELVAFVAGDSKAETTRHIQGCGECWREAAQLSAMEQRLRGALHRVDCPTPHQLGDYELGMAEAEERVRIAAHAVECQECGAELRQLRQYLAVEPPLPQSLFERARRMVAALVPPRPGPALAGVRGGGQSDVRLYRAEDVELSIGPGQQPGTIVGLLITESVPAGAEVRLKPASGEARVTAVDELGNFEFEGLPAGTYSLEIDFPRAVIIIPDVPVA